MTIPRAPQSPFVPVTLHKRDAFSETVSGHLAGEPARRVVMRRLADLPWWSRGLARWLARREARALAAAEGIEGVPVLLSLGREGLLRAWTEGTPLHLVRPADGAWYADAKRLLRALRRRGVSHNDLAKPQNWLVTPEGRAAVIDFQLAHAHRRHGAFLRLFAREDLRHLLKQKRAYAPDLLTPSERRMLARRSAPARIWRASFKPVYNFVTRRLMGWSDGEGTADRLEREGPGLEQALRGVPGTEAVVVTSYPRAGGGVGLYAFVEGSASPAALRRAVPVSRLEHLQQVERLPRDAAGRPRLDILALVAANRLDELNARKSREPALASLLESLVAGRLNLSDRNLDRA